MVEEGYLKIENKNLLIVGKNVSELMDKMKAYKSPKTTPVINKDVH